MIEKTFRLTNSFWHKFIPNTDKLLSPRNIKIDIWDLSTRKIVKKLHPEINCIKYCDFDDSGKQILFTGGCTNKISEFRIVKTNSFELLSEFSILEETQNAVFINKNEVCFGTWEGNLYSYNINEKKFNKIFSLPQSMIKSTIKIGDNIYLIVQPLASEHQPNYILIYNLETKKRKNIHINIKKHMGISGLSVYKDKLAFLTKERINTDIAICNLYVYDLNTNKLNRIKADFKTRGIIMDEYALSWNDKGLLAVIGLNEVFLFNNKKLEKTILFERPSSVVFSPDGKDLAIGGDKAKIVKL